MKRWPTKPLGDIVSLEYGKALKAEQRSEGGTYPVYGSNGVVGSHNEAIVKEPTIVLGRKGAVGEAHLAANGCWPIDTAFYTLFREPGIITLQYLLLWFQSVDLKSLAITATIPGLNRNTLYALQVPVPPLPEQERIVTLLGAAEQLRKLRAQADQRTADLIHALFHEMFGDQNTNSHNLAIVPLGSLLSFRTGKLDSNAAVETGEYPFFTCSRDDARINTFAFDCEALLLAGNNAIGEYSVKHYKGRFNAYQRTYVLNLLNADHSYGFMQQALQLRLQEMKRLSLGTNTKYLTLGILKNITIPLPDTALQKAFAQRVAEIRAFQEQQAASNTRLDALFQSMLHRAFSGTL